MKKFILLLICIWVNFDSFSQGKYLIYFKDKTDNPYSLSKPDQFLSQKSIQRRLRQKISIKESDLPVSPKYIDSLKKLGCKVWYTSRWFNAAYVYLRDTTLISKSISKKSYVTRIELLKNISDTTFLGQNGSRKQKVLKLNIENDDYGASYIQNQQICADQMHEQGYTGEGMTIAVFDGGFTRANNLFFFKNLFDENRVLGTHDFVFNQSYVYDYSDHGTNVLSCMAGYAKGSLIGTAYKANYYLFRTEDGDSEYPVEEANWLIAAERADSLGVDIINSSLGYSVFSDPKLSHRYKDRNGKKAISSRAATMASRVGMICVVSAGNDGSGSDPYVACPADADSIITVGAIDGNKKITYFSSYGPTVDGRIKPDVVAKGASVIVGSANNSISSGNGTSFASPVLCGMVAGLWQSLPHYTNFQIMDLVRESSTLYNTPDPKYGYGIPCFQKAKLISYGRNGSAINDIISPNPFSGGNLFLTVNQTNVGKDYLVEVYDINANLLAKQILEKVEIKNELNISPNLILPGLFIVKITTNNYVKVLKIIKN